MKERKNFFQVIFSAYF